MAVFESEYEKKSFTITTVLFILLFLFMIFFIIYPLPGDLIEEAGGGGGGEIAINFGNSATGSGNNIRSTDLDVAAKVSTPKTVTPTVKQVLTQNTKDAPVISQTKTQKTTTPIKVETPKPSKSTSDALSNLLNGSSNSGDGNDKTGGNKGQTNGDKNANGYNGGGGTGTGQGQGNGSGQGIGTGSGYGGGSGSGKGSGVGNYQLSGRKALSKPQPKYTCNEQGTVAVEISVNNAGEVISATAGVRGTTNSAKCLLDQAKIAAMNTKFDANDSAPEKQVGKIIYSFKLTD